MAATTESPAPVVDLKKKQPVVDEAKEEVKEEGLSNDVITKYTTAGQILGQVIKKLVGSVVAGKNALEICVEGDKLVADAVGAVYNNKKVKISKGLAFPTSVSVNNVVSHFSPLPSDPETIIKDGDVVKVMLGVQIDGYAVTHAETILIGTPTDGPKSNVIKAAADAAQAAMRLVKAGNKNWDVTEAVESIAKEYGCRGVEGMLSCQHEKNVTDGKKRILLNPTPELKREHETVTFEEGEVYGVDILIVTGDDGKAKTEEARTTIYKRANDVNYQLKMKTSRTVFSEIQKKAGAFPFTIRCLDDEKRARMGVQEAVQHGLLKPYEIVHTAAGTSVAEFFFTIALLPAGPLLLSPAPAWLSEDKIKPTAELKDEKLKALLTQKLREDKKKKNKAAKTAAAEGAPVAA